MVFAPLTQNLLEGFGWRGTLVILGGITLHLTLCGAIFKPPPKDKRDFFPLLRSDMKTSETYDAINCEDDEHDAYDAITCEDDEHDKDDKDDKDDERKCTYCFKFADLSLAAFADEYAWVGWIIYVVPHAEQKGLTSYQSASLSTVGGCSALIGMTIASVLIDRDLMKENTVKNLSLLFMGVSSLIDPLCNTLVSLMAATFVFGFGAGAVNTAILALTKSVVGTENLVKGISYISAITTIATLATSGITGDCTCKKGFCFSNFKTKYKQFAEHTLGIG